MGNIWEINGTCKGNMVIYGICLLVMTNIAMEKHHAINGQTDYFDCAIFDSYVKLSEGRCYYVVRRFM